MATIQITHDGPRLVSTDYWSSEHAAHGLLYLSINAGAFRLLLPPTQMESLIDMRTAREVIISRGPWPDQHRADAFELLFDDGSSSPFVLHLDSRQVDRLPADRDARKDYRCTVWTPDPATGAPSCVLDLPAYYRLSKRLPDLRPR